MNRVPEIFLCIALVVSGLVGIPTTSRAQAKVWENLGLYGGRVNDIAIDPINPDKMFAGTSGGGGLFVTTDGGSTWHPVETDNEPEGEGTFKNHVVFAAEIAPSNNNVIYVAHKIWVEKSTDGGQTWTHIDNKTMQQGCTNCVNEDGYRFCQAVAIHPTDPNTAYVGTAGPLNSYTNGAVFKTTDGGQTWTKQQSVNDQGAVTDDFPYSVVDLSIHPSNPNVIYAITNALNTGTYDSDLWRSTDGGQNWNRILGIPGTFYDLEVDPNDQYSIFVGADYGIFRIFSTDDGSNWTYQRILDLAWPWPPDAEVARMVTALAFDPRDSDVLYAAWKNIFGADPRPKVARGTRGSDPGNPFPDANWEIYTVDHQFDSLAVHPNNGNPVFGGGMSLGVFRGVYDSQGNNYTWTQINEGLSGVSVHDVAVDPNDSNHLLAATTTGVYEKNGTAAWFQLMSDSTRSVRFHPADSQTIFAGRFGYLANTTDGGLNWSNNDVGVRGWVRSIAIDPVQTETVFIAVGPEIRKSTDGGVTFTNVLYGQNLAGQQYKFNVVAIDPSDNQHLFAGGGNFLAPEVLGDLWESTNGGTDWSRTGLTNVIVNALLVDPRDSSVIYAGCGYSGGTLVPVYKSTDGGQNWNPSAEGIPPWGIHATSVWGTSGEDVFVVGNSGAIFNYDGRTWRAMSSGTTEELHTVWGASGTDVFAVGANGTILHFDGRSWTPMSSGTTEELHGVWGASATDVFVLGNSGTTLRYDGTTWKQIDISSLTTENLRSIWGSSGTDVFAVGSGGTVLRYDGTSWEPMSSGTTEGLQGVWGSSGTDVFAVGSGGTILRYDGTGWEPMSSGTTEEFQGVWGSSGTEVFAVGGNGTILRYKGTSWDAMTSDTPETLQGVWGSSETEVFAVGDVDVGDDHTILKYDGSAWSKMLPPPAAWNSVTDLEFHPTDKNVIYASTDQQGVYVSPNQAGNWKNLGTPDYAVRAISTSSLKAGTVGGLFDCGTGILVGQVNDILSPALGIDGAAVCAKAPDFTNCTLSINGRYMLIVPSGDYEVTANAAAYIDETAENLVTVPGGGVASQHLSMRPDLKIVDVLPHPNGGNDNKSPVPTNTSFAVLIHDDDGINIDIMDPSNMNNIIFSISDGVNGEFTRNLGDSAVRTIKLDPGEADTGVTRLWVVYDRSKDNDKGNEYAFGKVISIKIDAEDITGKQLTPQAEYKFKIETEAEHEDAKARVPETRPVDPTDPALGGLYDTGIQVASGPLMGAKIVYNSNEPVTPKFGPLEGLPKLRVQSSLGVGVPVNIQPHTVFATPVKLFIPCPAWEDVSKLTVCLLKKKWEVACGANGEELPGGVGWMKSGTRVNHNYGNPSVIELQVHHLSTIQAASITSPSMSSLAVPGNFGGTSGGGGCFIATVAYGSPVAKQVEILRKFRDDYLLRNRVGQGLVAFYYRIGKPIAVFMESHPWLKYPVRIILYPVVGLAWLVMSTSSLAKGFIGLCVLLVCVGAVKRGNARATASKVR